MKPSAMAELEYMLVADGFFSLFAARCAVMLGVMVVIYPPRRILQRGPEGCLDAGLFRSKWYGSNGGSASAVHSPSMRRGVAICTHCAVDLRGNGQVDDMTEEPTSRNPDRIGVKLCSRR